MQAQFAPAQSSTEVRTSDLESVGLGLIPGGRVSNFFYSDRRHRVQVSTPFSLFLFVFFASRLFSASILRDHLSLRARHLVLHCCFLNS